MWILHLIDKFSYCPFLPNLNLGGFQSKCLAFYKLPTEIAVFPSVDLKKNKQKKTQAGLLACRAETLVLEVLKS